MSDPMNARLKPSRETILSNRRARTISNDHTIYGEIYDAILDHRLPPGTKLTEDALGEIFGVSRTVVRKALFRLAHENIVRIRPHRGAVVASPSTEEARNVFEARRVVEQAVVRDLAGSVTDAQLGALRLLVDDEHAAYSRGDRRNWIKLSGQFHLDLAELSGNAVLAKFLKELVSRTSLIIALYEAPGQAACSHDEHLALIDAIADGDGDRAAALMAGHLEACEAKLNLDGDDATVDLMSVFSDVLRLRRPARRHAARTQSA